MTRFGFIIHPLTPKQIAKAYPIAQYLPDSVIEFFSARKGPKLMSEITGVRSKTGAETEGWFIGCPLTPDQMLKKLPLEKVYERLVQCTDMAAELGASLIGLGAFTSVVGDGGVTIQQRSKIGVTTGNSYTVATAIQGTIKAAHLLDIDLKNATLAVVGATGSIGKTCARILARDFGRTILIGRDPERTAALAAEIPNSEPSTDVGDIREADVVITVSSAGKELILPEHLRPGSIVCDVARPRDVSVRVTKERPDVLVIEGGIVRVPGNVEFNLNFGFPEKTAYACMSETMLLALEGDSSLFNFTLGKDVTVEQVDQISRLADKHGFELASFRSFEKEVSDDAILRARKARITAPTIARSKPAV
ncbi:shikimate dehydrogenase [Fimbriimonas ginsengisoli]|uniref:Acetylornithine aminotransferase n=1 Tax=Fimbriimonas ginsengisoli Gsoil 348 TaxID=661478 RepID=A0A068NYM5_FIMGI|nr:shikimate dehydrogenase [Fimbriimonas ginsengisoli]AIE87084.1 Acetylornithine aminotransferase [Fimbriimonas ginsengisoli Gsoil 348]